MKSINHFFNLGLAVSILTALGCAKDPFDRHQDPLTGYPELREDVRPEKSRIVEQTYAGQLVEVRAASSSEDGQVLNFIEGVAASHPMRIEVFAPDVKYSAKLHILDESLSRDNRPVLEKVRGDQNTFRLSWSPKNGTIPVGKTTHKVRAQIEVIIDSSTSPRSLDLLEKSKVNLIKSFTFQVAYKDQRPSIEISGLNSLDEVQLGTAQLLNFKVRVIDPNATASRPPEITRTYDVENFSGETKLLDLSEAVRRDLSKKPRFEGGAWVVDYVLDLSLVTAERYGKKSLEEALGGELVIFATSRASKLESERKLIRVTFKRPAASTPIKTDGKPEPKAQGGKS